MNTERCFDVVKGPSRDLIIDAFKYAYEKDVDLHPDFSIVQFYVGHPTDNSKRMATYMPAKNFRITGIEHEDGSGESWILKGACDADLDNVSYTNANLTHYGFRMYYNSKRREGTISFIIR